jgi:2,4-dienoyl-CoA reductase-like NADH-dependent reductase (Old Yellow Enzyme family)
MCQYSVPAGDGVPTNWHLVHLGSMASGGAGLIIAEATAVEPEGRISPHDTGIWNEEQAKAWKPIVEFIRQQGAVAGIQLAHAGRKASIWPDGNAERKTGTMTIDEGGWQTIAPSAIEFPGYLPPREMTANDIARVETAFVEAAQRAVAAGFQVIEIHAAHGYLLHEFLSPLSNLRTDEFGGALENRARLLVNIVKKARATVGDAAVIFVRFSATDWLPEGLNEEECAVVADWCIAAGADMFDVSSGGNVTGVTIPVGQGYQVPLASFIKQHAHGPTAAVGLITEAEYANSVITSGQADAVLIGREHLRDPHWVMRAAVELGENIDYWPRQYRRAKPAIGSGIS